MGTDLEQMLAAEGANSIIRTGLEELAESVHALGVNHAATERGTRMGAIESHGLVVEDAAKQISGGLEGIAEALNNIADAIRGE